jgi:hypothetical protein
MPIRPILAAALLALVAAGGEERKPRRPLVAFSGAKSRIEKAECRRVTGRKEWTDLWLRHVGADPARQDDFYNEAGVPEIDFDACMVVAVFQGGSWNSAGVEVVSIDEDDARLLVRFDQTEGPGGGGVRVNAFGVFVLPRSAKPVVLEENVQNLIGEPPVWKERARLP